MNKEVKVAKEAALEAGNLILSFYKADYEIRDKGYHNPVTTADHASDNRIKEILIQSFPDRFDLIMVFNPPLQQCDAWHCLYNLMGSTPEQP